MKKNSRNAQGAGTIRQRLDGRWEARYTAGRDPGTGRQIQKSIYGASQEEVLKKLQATQVDMENGSHIEPSKMTVAQWLDIWTSEYLGGVKQSTKASYEGHIKNHIKPSLGAVALQKLKPHQIQSFYNGLQRNDISSKTIRNIHGIFHAALKQAMKIGYLKNNPTEACTLPRWSKQEINVLDDNAVTAFLEAIAADEYGTIYFIDLFTGMRQSEILGLTWEAVDFKAGTILVKSQLLRERKKDGIFYLDTTKNSKVRKIKPAPMVMDRLKDRRREQIEQQLRAGPAWSNPWNLVFTDPLGAHLVHLTVYRHFKAIVKDIGFPDLRFHDLRHSYAVISIMSGDDIKTIQENLGHHTAAFTLDTYAHVTDQMRDESAQRMEKYIKSKTKKA